MFVYVRVRVRVFVNVNVFANVRLENCAFANVFVVFFLCTKANCRLGVFVNV